MTDAPWMERNQINCEARARGASVWGERKERGACDRAHSCQHDGPFSAWYGQLGRDKCFFVQWAEINVGMLSLTNGRGPSSTSMQETGPESAIERSRFERSAGGLEEAGQWLGETKFKFRFQSHIC